MPHVFNLFENVWFNGLVSTAFLSYSEKFFEWYVISAFVNQSNNQPSIMIYIEGKLIYSSYSRACLQYSDLVIQKLYGNKKRKVTKILLR